MFNQQCAHVSVTKIAIMVLKSSLNVDLSGKTVCHLVSDSAGLLSSYAS